VDLFLLATSHGRQTYTEQRSRSAYLSDGLENKTLTIDFIKEDDTRLRLLCLIEKQSKLAFGFADPLAKAIGTFAHKEGCEQLHC
jgi:hypothetical protein